ncbi:hypothetical protein BGX31_007418 [Mortierella sp. GBA43]|nr:hypothetical protein BGX31_007418 [Mortierella sp. GBA43]
MTAESASDILARIWPEYDPNGVGIMANMMEIILRRVEEEQGSSLLAQPSWDELRDYVKCVEGTIVSQKDLSDLLSLLQNTSQLAAAAAAAAGATAPVMDTSSLALSEGQGPLVESETDDRYNNSISSAGDNIHSRPASHPRPKTAGIRKISLSGSSQYRPYHSRVSHGSSDDEELDNSDYRVSLSRGSHGTHSIDPSAPSDPESPTPGDSKQWVEGSFNHMSIREQSRTEYEGYGLEVDYRTPESQETREQALIVLQRKLKETERLLEYQDRALEQARAQLNQQETEDLKRKVRELHRQISESNTQISEMTQQIEVNERVNSTQKSNAAAWKKQKDDLERENNLIREDLRRKEDELRNRLDSDDTVKRKIADEQQENSKLREQLAQQIAEKEEIARTLEMLVSRNLQSAELAELNGHGNETENMSSIGAFNLTLDLGPNVQAKNLMSELYNVDPVFGSGSGSGSGNQEGDANASGQQLDGTSSQRARQLLQDAKIIQKKLKRSSMLDLGQRFYESMEISLDDASGAGGLVTGDHGQGSSSAAVVVRDMIDDDDVDCALPQELQTLETKDALLDENLQTQERLIDDLFQLKEAEAALAATASGSMVVEGIIRPNAAFANLQKTERARRRKPQQSRIVSPDVISMLNAGVNTSSSSAVSKKDTKKAIANVTLVSVYTIVVYLLGLVTSVFMVDSQSGAFNAGRFLSYDAMQGPAAGNMNGGGRFGVIEVLVYWIQNLVWQGDGAAVPT